MNPPAPVTNTFLDDHEGLTSPTLVRSAEPAISRVAPVPFTVLLNRLSTAVRQRRRYRPSRYWEARAPELIEAYDRPETWPTRQWMAAGIEETEVPRLLHAEKVRTVLVAGAGTGRQYEYLVREGFDPSGFDISPSLVRASRERFPEVRTNCGDVVGAETRETPADAVITSAVLQHVPPTEIDRAVESIQALAKRFVVIREVVELLTDADYQFAHDYSRLFANWHEVRRTTTDEWPGVRVEIIAWRRP
jgi:SAM-dependent methyltransferase